MKLFSDLLELISGYLVNGIFISVPVVWIASFFRSVNIQYAKSTLKWIMIGYACFALVNLIIILLDGFYNGVEFWGYSFGYWAFGSNWLSFWFMMISNLVLPFILLVKRIGNKLIFLFLIGILMNIGWLFESFVVLVTSIHRDYIPGDWQSLNSIPLLPYGNEIYLLRGLILGILVLGLGIFLKKRNG